MAVAGQHSSTGRPLLVNSIEDLNRMPGRYYIAKLRWGEGKHKFEVTGATQPGMLFFLSGSNGRFSWAWSKVNYDSIDLYKEDISLNDTRSHITVDKEEEILIRDNPSHNEKTYFTEIGPLISSLFYNTLDIEDNSTALISAKYPYPKNSYKYYQYFLDLHLCPTIHCAADSLQKLDGIPSDYVLVDNKEIVHVVSGTFPIRKDKHSGHKIWTPIEDDNWIGFVHAIDKPRGINPKEGYYVGGSSNELVKETRQVTRMK